MTAVLSRWNWSENGMVQEDNGPFYLCDDYAALRAELIALQQHLEAVRLALGLKGIESRPVACYVDDLKAETERLRLECDRLSQSYTILEAAAHEVKTDLTTQLAAMTQELVCSVCKTATDIACSDCRIDLATTVYVCPTTSCRDAHEKKCPGTLMQERAAIKQAISAEFAKKVYTDEDRAHEDLLENLGVFLDHHNDLEQQLAERDAHILALAQEGLTAGDEIAKLRAHITTLEAAIVEANAHNSVCVWNGGEYPHTCIYKPLCELTYCIINQAALQAP